MARKHRMRNRIFRAKRKKVTRRQNTKNLTDSMNKQQEAIDVAFQAHFATKPNDGILRL